MNSALGSFFYTKAWYKLTTDPWEHFVLTMHVQSDPNNIFSDNTYFWRLGYLGCFKRTALLPKQLDAVLWCSLMFQIHDCALLAPCTLWSHIRDCKIFIFTLAFHEPCSFMQVGHICWLANLSSATFWHFTKKKKLISASSTRMAMRVSRVFCVWVWRLPVAGF